MARPWRIQYEGAIYHIMSRGSERETIFLTDEDYLRFLGCIERAVEKFQLDILVFVLMGNHYHLLLRIPLANLSKAMQWLQTAIYLKVVDKKGKTLYTSKKTVRYEAGRIESFDIKLKRGVKREK